MSRIKKDRTSVDILRLAANKITKVQTHVAEAVNHKNGADFEELALRMAMLKKLGENLQECENIIQVEIANLKLSLVEQVTFEDKKELDPVS